MNGNNNSEVIHLTEPMVLELISKVEQSIIHITGKMDSKIQNLKEAEELYLPLKQEYDMFQEALNKEKILLQTLVGFKDNVNIRKNVRVLKSVSNSKPSKHSRPRLPITNEAIKIFERSKQFMRMGNLVDKMFEVNPTWKPEWKEDIKKNLYSVNTKATNPKIKQYDGKWGLPEWFDKLSNTPHPQFLNSIIHA